MGCKFRKSVKMGPVRVNLSKSGVGYSVGGKGLRVTKKAGGGTRTTAKIPGTGISYTKDSSKRKSTTKATSKRNSSQSSAATSSNGSGGCLTSCLWIVGICFVIGLIRKFWKILLIIAAILIVGFIAFAVYRKKNTAALPETTDALDTMPNSSELPPDELQIDPASDIVSNSDT